MMLSALVLHEHVYSKYISIPFILTEPSCVKPSRALQQALCAVIRGDAIAGGRPHVHGLRHPHHFWLPARLPEGLEV